MYKGELLALATMVSWTACALFGEVASKRMETLPFNVVRMTFCVVLLGIFLWIFTGNPYPTDADKKTWFWLAMSGFVGYVLGDFCLYNSYNLIGARYGQLLMTLAPPAASLTGWIMLGEKMSMLSLLGMTISIMGIIIVIHRPKKESEKTQKISPKGILYGIGAGIGQGVGLVLSSKGLHCYSEAIEGSEISINIMSFEGTFIRAIMGLIGFSIWTFFKYGIKKFIVSATQTHGLPYTLAATITGPFIGVGMSLMATQYTSTGIAQTIMSLTPVFIILPTYIIYHQQVTLKEIFGAIIAVSGVTLFFV